MAAIVSAAVEPRGVGLPTLRRLKKKCKGTLNSDKSVYVSTCNDKELATQNEQDNCILDAIMADASVECKDKLIKVLGVER